MSNLKNLNKDQLISMVNQLKTENIELKDVNQQLQLQLEDIKSQLSVARNTSGLLADRIVGLETRASQQEQYSRRECLEFSGIPLSVEHNDLEEKVLFILKKIDVDIPSQNIEACHRVGKQGTTIVKFSRRKDISKIFLNKKKLKHVDENSLLIPENTRIYINESLCPAYRDIWHKCKKLWNEKRIARFWTSNGAVRIKIKQLGNPIVITHLSDLKKEFPDVVFD